MLYPSIFGENLFDDFFRFPDFGRDVEKKLYGKHAAQVMKTFSVQSRRQCFADSEKMKKQTLSKSELGCCSTLPGDSITGHSFCAQSQKQHSIVTLLFTRVRPATL